MWLHTVVYRLWQVRQQLGFVAPLTAEEGVEVARWLPLSALPLFQTMSAADQRHSLRVCRGLQARGCMDKDMFAAALLHDVGKAGGRVPFWTRPVIVLGKMCAPRLLARVVVDPRTASPPHPTVRARPRQGSPTIHEFRGLLRSMVGVPLADTLGSNPGRFVRSLMMVWRRSLGYAWWHAEIGAELAAEAGLPERAVLYIRTHHQPDGPAAELHIVDEAS
jgi:hypothetical protein